MANETTTSQAEGTEVGTTTASDAPWSSDLEAAFADPEVRAQVDEFLAGNVQPYITKIEQEARPNRDATRLWEQFNEDPVSTAVQVNRELFGDAIADRFAQLLQEGASPEEAQAQAVAEEAEAAVEAEAPQTRQKIEFDQLPPEVQNAIAAQQAEEQRIQYYAEIDRVQQAAPDEFPTNEDGEPDVELFHPFVVAANGDFDAALDGYKEWAGRAKSAFGIKVPEGEVEVPPTTINSETRDSSATPPQEKNYEGDLDAALDDFFAEQSNPPPTVGSA